MTYRCNLTVDFILKDDIGVIEVYGSGMIYEEDEENPDAADMSMGVPVVLLLSGTVVLTLLLCRKSRYKRESQ